MNEDPELAAARLATALRAAALGPEPGSDETDLVRRIGRRSRTRRRRRVGGVAAGVAFIAIVASLFVPTSTRQSDRPAVLEPATPAATIAPSASPSSPVTTVALGAVTRLPVTLTHSLLIVDTEGLALLSGNTRTELTGTGGAGSPGISPDGKWLSWLTNGSDADSSVLHIVRSTGGAVALTRGATSYAWAPGSYGSPAADDLAVAEQSSVVIFTPELPDRVSVPEKFPYEVVWSSDGSHLAYSGSVQGGVLAVRATAAGVEAGQPTLLPQADGSDYVAGFYGDGLLLWPNPSHSASIAADGLALSFLNLSTGVTTPLTETLTYPDWVQELPQSGTPSGDEVLVVAGGDRIAEDHKSLKEFEVETGAMGVFPPRSRPSPVTGPADSSVVSLAVFSKDVNQEVMNTVATVITKQDSNYGTSYPLGTLYVQALNAVSAPVGAAGHSVVAVGSSADGFLVVQPKSLQLLRPGGSLHALGELGTGPDRNAGYYGHLAISDLVAVATG